MNRLNFKKVSLLLLLVLSTFSLGCREKGGGGVSQNNEEVVTIVFYGLKDDESVYESMIKAFEARYDGQVDIIYKKFTDEEAYMGLIINELAEGDGPDVFMLDNDLFPKHYKKLSPAPTNQISVQSFKDEFVEASSSVLIFPDENGVEQIWGLTLYVDTLGLFYNKDHFEDAIPSSGKPGITWDEILDQVVLLNREDNSFEGFERSGIAMGQVDNISKAFDILMLLFLQKEVSFYSNDLSTAIFASDPNALEVLDLYSSFGLPSEANYSWNPYLSDTDYDQLEISTFAKGKVSMFFGYPSDYEEILTEIKVQKNNDQKVISASNVIVQEVPQFFDPEISADTREAYANYYALVVSRTSENPEIAWDFILFLANEDNLRLYFEATHHPTSKRSLIEEQLNDPIYGPFVAQVGYADNILMSDPAAYKESLFKAINSILDTKSSQAVLNQLEAEIQELIPSTGIRPQGKE